MMVHKSSDSKLSPADFAWGETYISATKKQRRLLCADRLQSDIDRIVAAVKQHQEQAAAKLSARRERERKQRVDRRRDIAARFVNHAELVRAWSEEMIDVLLGPPDVEDNGVRRFLRVRVEQAKQDVRFADMLRRSKLVTTTTLRERGWTQTLIDRFMPKPDILAENPHYKSAASMKLYRVGRIEDIEQKPNFIAMREKTVGRIAGAKRAAITRKRTLRLKQATNEILIDLQEREARLIDAAGQIVQSILQHEQVVVMKAASIVRAVEHANKSAAELELDACIAHLPDNVRLEVALAVRLPKGTPNRLSRELKAFRDAIRDRLNQKNVSDMQDD